MKRRKMLKASGLLAIAMATGQLEPAAGSEAAQPPLGVGGSISATPSKQTGPTLIFRRTIPVRHEVDVFIAGGGPAGIAAALAARNQNTVVFLAEGHSCFGGMGTAGRVPAFMQFTDGVNFLSGGVGRIIHDLWREKASCKKTDTIHTEALKRIYDDLMVESKADFAFYTMLIGVEAQGGHVKHVICQGKTGPFAVKAKAYVDCTGDGDLAAWAGASFEKGDENGDMMPGTLCSTWSDIDWEMWNKIKTPVAQPDGVMIRQAIADGVLTVPDEHLTGMYRLGLNLGAGNIGHVFGVDGTDEVSLTKALLWGRKSLKEYEHYYKKYLKGFEKMELAASGSLLGIRESRRITGDAVLTEKDYLKRATFPDEIGRYAYPVDIHPLKPVKGAYALHRQEMDVTYHYKRGESYGIPYRILIPKGLDNVLVAGRCVSADRIIQASIRVMPGCFITGQAAGMAAALAAGRIGETRAVDVKELQRRLKAMGGYLPNA